MRFASLPMPPAAMLSLDELMPVNNEELGLLLQDAGKGPEDTLLLAEKDYIVQQAVLLIPATLRASSWCCTIWRS